jgi:protoporphyrinogen oxidase
MGQLYEVLAGRIRERGGEIRTGVRVVGVETLLGRATAVRVNGPRGPERIPATEILATIPLPDLVRHLRPDSTAVAETAQRMRFRALVFVNLMLKRRDFSENTWMYVASGRLSASRIQEPKRRSAWMAPSGHTSIMLEVPCDVGDGTWRAGVDDLRQRMQAELSTLGLPVSDVLGAFVVRVEHGYPVYHVGYDADRHSLLAEVARFPNVRTAGRQGLFRYVFMDAAMKMGMQAARQMVSGERAPLAIDAIGRKRGVTETFALTA